MFTLNPIKSEPLQSKISSPHERLHFQIPPKYPLSYSLNNNLKKNAFVLLLHAMRKLIRIPNNNPYQNRKPHTRKSIKENRNYPQKR